MIKKIFIVFCLFSTLEIKAETVDSLKIIGNKRISAETIKVYGDIKIGSDYDETGLNNILKNLYSTNFFKTININLKNNNLTLEVEEYPLINFISFFGEKSNTIKNSILERLQLQNNQSFISNKLNDDVSMIKNIYASLGFNFVKVNTKIENFDSNRINIIFDIEKGNRSFIKRINFIGNKILKDSTLKDIIASEEKKFWKVFSRNTFFSEPNIDLDKRLLINYYKSLGYYDVQVISNSSEILENNFIQLTYNINAGKRYKIKKISSNVQDVIDKSLFISLEDNYRDLIGKYYSPFKVKKLLDQLDTLIADSDLQFIEHSVNEILENESIEIKINIYEGKKFLLEKVNIYGNSVTDESVIRSELIIDEGDPFNELKILQSIDKLKSRNLFGEIKSNVIEGSSKDQKILEISVEEKPTGEITAGAGIGTNGGSFLFQISENNWLGKGLGVSTNFEISKETLVGGISVTDPNYNFTGNSLKYFLTQTKNDKPNSGFKNNIFSSGIGTKFEQYKDVFLSPNLIFSHDSLEVESTASASLKKQKGTFSDLSVDYSIISDKRDRTFGPTEGYLTSFNQSFPIFADSPFIKNAFQFNKYYSFTPNMIGSFKFYGAAINGLDKKDVRLSKRLDLNNSRLRGFESGKIGPKDGKDFIGGNYATSFNFDVNLPNLLPDSTNIDVSFYLDAGNLWHVDYSNEVDSSNKIRSSTGVAANYSSPIGPMSFIFSKNLSKAKTDIDQSFNFRIGTTF